MLANLKLRQLRLVVALDESRKLQSAADRLNLSQSAASKMLAEIEAVTTVPLFERGPRGVQPTPYGQILIRGSKKILADLELAALELAGYRMGELGNLSIGAVASPSVDLVIDSLEYLGDRADRIRLSLHVATSVTLIERLQALELEFIVARIPLGADAGQFVYHKVGDDEEVCLLVRAEHPLSERDNVTLDEMVHLQWVAQQHGSFMRQSLERLFANRRLSPPRRVINTDSFIASLGIIARTDAIVPVPVYVVDLMNPARFRKLRFAERITLESYGLIKLKDRTLSPVATLLFDAMAASYGS